MRRILDEVRSGEFAREWITERERRSERLRRLRDEESAHPLEETGKWVRRQLGGAGGVDSGGGET